MGKHYTCASGERGGWTKLGRCKLTVAFYVWIADPELSALDLRLAVRVIQAAR